MKTRWILASLTLMIATAAGALAADARPADRDGQKASRVVSDRFTDGFRTLEFRGVAREDGSMTVGIEFRRGSEAPSRVLISTRRFKTYESSLTAFFSGIEPEFLKSFRARLPELVKTAASRIDGGDEVRVKDRAQLVLAEMGAYQYARKSMEARGVREVKGGADCAEIALEAYHIYDCLAGLYSGPMGVLSCKNALLSLGHSIDEVDGCIDAILQFICESNGYPWRWIPGSGGYGDKCIECFDQDAHACDMVVTAVGDGDTGGRHQTENQDPNSSGGGSIGGFSFVWGSDGGTVTVQTCYVILLPDGSAYISCN